MKGQQLWDELEQRARQKYGVGDKWHLSAVDIGDREVAKIELGRKGPRGGWLRGKENSIKGVVVWSGLNEIEQAEARKK